MVRLPIGCSQCDVFPPLRWFGGRPPQAISYTPMSNFASPSVGVPAPRSRAPIRLQIVSSCAASPEGDGWLHEIKHDGHRQLAIIARDDITLISRNGRDHTAPLREPFRGLAGLPPLVR